MGMGTSFAEYEASVGPANKHFHETAETIVLYKEGVLPLEVDTTKRSTTGSQSTATRTGPDGEEYTHPDPSTESRDSQRRADRYE